MSAEIRISTAALEPADLHEIHQRFSSMPEGQNLARSVRYDTYRPSHISTQEWVSLLGPDVHNLDHMPVTQVIGEFFIRKSFPGQFDEQEEVDLRTATLTHDWGEGVPGFEDITYRKKTKEDSDAEHQAVLALIDCEFGENEPDLASEMKRVHQEVVNDQDSYLGRAFNTIERMGHLRTAVRAWEMMPEQYDDPELQNALQWMTIDVLAHHVETLLERADEYPATHEQLEVYEEQISNIFDTFKPGTFYNYEKGEERDRVRSLFRGAKDAWKEQFPDDERPYIGITHYVNVETLLSAGFNYAEHSAIISDPESDALCYVHIAERSYFGRPDDDNILIVIEKRPDDEGEEPEFYLNSFSGRPRGQTRTVAETAEYDQKAFCETLDPAKKVTGDELADFLEPSSRVSLIQ